MQMMQLAGPMPNDAFLIQQAMIHADNVVRERNALQAQCLRAKEMFAKHENLGIATSQRKAIRRSANAEV